MMRLLRPMLSTLATLLLCNLAVADEPDSGRVVFNIPQQPLSEALAQWSRQSGLQVLRRDSDTSGAEITSSSVTGEYSPAEALSKMLARTGLKYEFVNDRTVRISVAVEGSQSAVNAREGEKSDSFRLAQADQTVSGGAAAVEKSQLEEVLVTAQKREERLSDVPVSVSVIDTQALTENNQVLLRDLSGAVPGLTVTPTIENGQALTIRGISNGPLGYTHAVAITVDGIPTNEYVGPDFDPGDIERIEVLRGPQGTLYGADSIGGLINYVTTDPSRTAVSGRVQVGGSGVSNGAELGYNVRGAVNVPLGETLALRASAFTREDPGYIDDVLTGQDGVNKATVYGGRVSALWSPSDITSLKISALYQHMDGGEPLAYVPTPGYPIPTPGHPGVANLGPLQQNEFAGGGEFSRVFQVYSAVMKARLGQVDLVSLTGYDVTKANYSFDYSYLFGGLFQQPLNLDFTPGANVIGISDNRRFSEELRASAQLGRVDWMVGGFYTRIINPGTQNVYIDAVTPVTGQFIANGFYNFTPTSNAEYAGFADLTFHFTQRFDIQVGARESWDKQVIAPAVTIAPLLGAPQPAVAPGTSGTVSAATYLFTPKFQISPDLMVYARVASGFAPGGPNLNYVLNPNIPRTYAPSTTWSYEAGFKGEVLDHALSIDASVYYIDWRNLQLSLAYTPVLGYIGNGGGAKSEGMELSLESRPLTGLKLSGWVAYDNAVLTKEFPINDAAYGVPGNRLPDSSRFSVNLGFEQELPLGRQLTAFVGGDVAYVGDSWGVFTAKNPDGSPSPRTTYPSYTKIDLHAGVSYASWKASIFGTNLADRRAAIDGGYGEYPPFERQYITPRTIGVTLVKTF